MADSENQLFRPGSWREERAGSSGSDPEPSSPAVAVAAASGGSGFSPSSLLAPSAPAATPARLAAAMMTFPSPRTTSPIAFS